MLAVQLRIQRRAFVRKTAFILTVTAAAGILLAGASAQTDRPAPVPQPSPGVQINNAPGDQESRQPDYRDRQRLDQNAPETGDQRRNVPKFGPEFGKPEIEPDIEFQDFVASSLGYKLPIFGHNLFRNVPSTFAPLDRVPVTPDYLIGPGDELIIRAWGQIDVNYHAIVDRNGSIYVPKVGTVTVSGVRYEQLNDYLKSAIGRVFKNFDLNVTLGQLRSIQVFVVGQARRPGVYTVSSLSSLVNALFASGGPSKRGSMRHIELKRDGKLITVFDLYDLLAGGDKSKDAKLLPGDVIYVAPVGRLVALAGSVNVPAVYELRDHDTLGDVINYAGGLSTTAAAQRAIVERIDDHHARTASEFPLSPEGLKTELHDGDVVRFLHVSPKFDNAVTIRGNVAVPGRYPWHEGMRVKDLIPSREFLVTQEFWKQQNKLSIDPDSQTYKLRDDRLKEERDKKGEKERATQPIQPNPQPMPQVNYPGAKDQDLASQVGKTEAQKIKQEELKNEVKRSAADINWAYAVVQRINPDDLTTHLLPFDLGKAIAGDDGQNIQLRPGDVVTIFSQSDMQVPTGQQSKFVRLEGEFKSAGVYQVEPGETLRHLIGRVGGLTDQAYLYGAEFTRESAKEDQQRRLDEYVNDLEKSIERNASSQRNLSGEEALTEKQSLEGQRRLLEKLRQLKANGRIVLELRPNASSADALPDLVLEDGDRLLVPFRPATVNVIGSVYNSNSFIYKPGKTFGDYLRLAGGATRNGDRGRAFIIRADGTTLSSKGHSGLLTLSFNNARLMPGDSIVVPEKLDKGVVLRGFKDWTQIIGQFVIGAAAAKVLFP